MGCRMVAVVIRVILFTAFCALALIGADRVAGTGWAVFYGIGAVVLIFGWDSAARARRRASYVIRHAERHHRRAA